jgi:hypothetical protein
MIQNFDGRIAFDQQNRDEGFHMAYLRPDNVII